MKLRDLLRKINDAVRPVHVQGEGPASNPLADARVAGRVGNIGGTAIGTGPEGQTEWMPSQQDEEPHS